MLDVLRIMSKLLLAPFWLLWKGYQGLWWAFDDSDKRRVAASASIAPPGAPPPPNPHTDSPRFGPEQKTSFEFTDSTPRPAKPPIGPLRGGFIGTLILSAAAGITALALADSHTISSGHAWLVWAWGTLAPAVGSLFVVRHVARKYELEKPTTVFGKARAAAGGVKDAAFSAGKGVGKLCVHGVCAAKATHRGIKAAACSRPAQSARRGLAGAWTSLRARLNRAAPAAPATSA